MDATAQLWEAVTHRRRRKAKVPLEVEKVRDLVRGGADIFYTPDKYEADPILHQLVRGGEVEAFLVCLEGPKDLDFTVSDTMWNTVPQCIAQSTRISVRDIQRMMEAVVQHIERHPCDAVNWSNQNNDGKDFVDLAAENELLSVLYTVVKDMPHFSDQTEPMALKACWVQDVAALDDVDRAAFDVSQAKTYVADESTSRLWRLCEMGGWNLAEPEAVSVFEKCVKDGADVLFVRPGMERPILFELLRCGGKKCVLAAVRTLPAFDYTTLCGGSNADRTWSVLHCLARQDPAHPSFPDVLAILHAIIDHVALHPASRIDWGLKDGEGNECISLAALWGWLSMWWAVVTARAVPYYVQHAGRIEVTQPVRWADWVKIPESDKPKFKLQCDF